MKLRELFENIYATEEQPAEFDGALKVIGVCYGRWNPPHKGHKAVWQGAASNPIWYVGTNENTEGPKDPLPYDVKLQCMAAVWPKVAGHVIPEQSLLTLASRIYEEHGENVHLKVYTDEEWLYKTLAQYNGVQDKPHGSYKFNQIDWVRTERLARATDLRDAVRRGDKAAFYKDAGVKPNITVEVNEQHLPIFDVVAHYLNKYPSKVKNADAMQVAEAVTQDKIYKASKLAGPEMMTTPKANLNAGDAYINYRMNIALAGAPEFPTKAESEIGGDPLFGAYTDEEAEMVNMAAKMVGAGHVKKLSKRKSQEMPDTYKVSPVAKPKRNKYGV